MKLKRFAPLAILLAIITMSGVFATWIYANNGSGSKMSAEMQFGMEAVDMETGSGKYTISTSGDRIFHIDQTDNNPDSLDYTAKLVVTPSATIKITFTPHAGASDTIKTNGIATNMTFAFKTGTTQSKYEDKQIIVFTKGTEVINPYVESGSRDADKLYWEKSSQPNEQGIYTFSFELDATDIDERVDLGGTFVLDSLDKHNAFSACLDTYTCVLVVTDPNPVVDPAA